MKAIKPFVLVCLLSSLLLAGCDEGGFSVAPSSEFDEAEEYQGHEVVEQPTGDGVHGGGDGANSEDNPEEAKPLPDDVTPGSPQEPAPQIDLGTQILIFQLDYISISNDNYVTVTYSDDPFEEKYNFSFYTIDNQELENSRSVIKDSIDGKDICKFYLGSKESKTYTIQFYDKDGKLYGKSEFTVVNPVINQSFFNNIFNIIEIKFIIIGNKGAVTYEEIFQVIKAKGYNGTVAAIRMFMQKERAHAQSVERSAGKEYLYRVALSQLVYHELENVKLITSEQYDALLKQYPELASLYDLIKEFNRILFSKKADEIVNASISDDTLAIVNGEAKTSLADSDFADGKKVVFKL